MWRRSECPRQGVPARATPANSREGCGYAGARVARMNDRLSRRPGQRDPWSEALSARGAGERAHPPHHKQTRTYINQLNAAVEAECAKLQAQRYEQARAAAHWYNTELGYDTIAFVGTFGEEGVPTAATITMKETLDLLDGPYLAVSEGVTEGRYAFWLGSGISRERVIGGMSRLMLKSAKRASLT